MSSSFSFPRPTTTTDDLEDLYKAYGVERAVVLDLAGATETPKPYEEGIVEPIFLSFILAVLLWEPKFALSISIKIRKVKEP